MVEIACPNCNARYEVPADALGPDGREVACSNCEHVWLARPDAPSGGPPETAADAAEGGEASFQPPPREDRTREMARIRDMLDEVQSTERRRSGLGKDDPHATERWAGPTAPVAPPQPAGMDDEVKALRDAVTASEGRQAQVAGYGNGYEETPPPRRRSGAGSTGFLLAIVVTALLVGVYAFHPQIIAAAPQFEPAIMNYVGVVESLRGMLVQVYESALGAVGDSPAN